MRVPSYHYSFTYLFLRFFLNPNFDIFEAMPKATTKAATPRKAPLSRPPAPTEDSVYKSGDFALISSDNVSFKVNTHYLLSARYVEAVIPR